MNLKKNIIAIYLILNISMICIASQKNDRIELLSNWYKNNCSNLDVVQKNMIAKSLNNTCINILTNIKKNSSAHLYINYNRICFVYSPQMIINEQLDSLMKLRDELLGSVFSELSSDYDKLKILNEEIKEDNIKLDFLQTKIDSSSGEERIKNINEFNSIAGKLRHRKSKADVLQFNFDSNINKLYKYTISIYKKIYELCKNDGEILSLL